jgi:hypothetical protein
MTPAFPVSPEDEALIDATYQRIGELAAQRRIEKAIENFRAALRAQEVSEAYIAFVRKRAREIAR